MDTSLFLGLSESLLICILNPSYQSIKTGDFMDSHIKMQDKSIKTGHFMDLYIKELDISIKQAIFMDEASCGA